MEVVHASALFQISLCAQHHELCLALIQLQQVPPAPFYWFQLE